MIVLNVPTGLQCQRKDADIDVQGIKCVLGFAVADEVLRGKGYAFMVQLHLLSYGLELWWREVAERRAAVINHTVYGDWQSYIAYLGACYSSAPVVFCVDRGPVDFHG